LKLSIAAAFVGLASCGAALAAPAADAPIATHDAPLATKSAPAKATFEVCAGAYAALARHQDNFGTEGSLMSERYPNYARINFNDRLSTLARQAEKGVTELKADANDRHHDYVQKLVDAETEGDLATEGVKDVAFIANQCDVQYGFFPSLGGTN
jgi:hypothetical protein